MPNRKLTDDELALRQQKLNEALAEGYDPPGISVRGRKGSAVEYLGRRYGFNVGSLRRLIQIGTLKLSHYKPKAAQDTPPIPLDERVRLEADLAREKDRTTHYRKLYDASQKELMGYDSLKEFVTGFRTGVKPPKGWSYKPRKKSRGGTPLLHWSDWHIGEVVSLSQTAGYNEFNMDIAERRIKMLVQKTLDLCFVHSAYPTYEEVVVVLGGDMVSGQIHDLRETNEGTIMEQVKETAVLIMDALKTVQVQFPRVRVYCVVGNHGRNSYKPKTKNRVQDNFEWLLYHFLAAMFSDNEHIHFEIPDDTDVIFEVEGHRFLATHGDSTGARGGDGIIGPAGPIIRGEKRVRDSNLFLDLPYDTCLMGHYHIEFGMAHVKVNPTLKGYDEFARYVLRVRPERPAQNLFFIHPEEGIVDEKRVYLEPKRRI